MLRYAWEGEPMATVISLCSSDSDCDLGGPPEGATGPPATGPCPSSATAPVSRASAVGQRSRSPVRRVHCSDEALACSRKHGATVGHSSFVDLDSHSRVSPPFGRPAQYACRLQQFCATRNRCFTHDALVQCHTEDASVTPSRPFACLSPFIGCEMELTLLNTAPLLYQEGEAPPPAFVVDAPQIAPAPVPTEPAALTDDDDELKRVPVLILVFQGPCQQHTLWISSDESLDSFMTRASILLNPDPVHFDLLPANPQPDGTRFLFVLAPNWWALSGMRPVVCHLRQPDCEPFVHVVFPGEDLEASLPHAIFGMHGQLDLYLPPTSPGQHVAVAGPRSLALELQPGALLLFQADAGLPPDLLAPLEHLRAMSHVRAEEFPDDVLYRPHPCDVVLLGVEYEQYVLRLGGVPIKRLVSSSLGIAEADVYLHHQPVPFAQLTVAGQAVSACFGLRSRAVHGGEPVGRGMFIDCRAVGRPVVYRTVQALRLCPSDVCHMLDVGIPAGYRAWCEGAVACDKYPDYFLVEHGINLTNWVDSDSPVASPASAPAPDDGSDGMSDDSSSSDDNNQRHVSSTGGHRSRSPRRPAPGPHGRQHQPGLACPAALQDHPAPCAEPCPDVRSHASSDALCWSTRLPGAHQAHPVLQPVHVGNVATPCRSRCLQPADAAPSSANCPHSTFAGLELCAAAVADLLPTLCSPLTVLECGTWHSVPFAADDFNVEAAAAARALRQCPATILCLAELCPLTEHQRLALELRDLLPLRRGHVAFGDDWLDADISGVLRSPFLPRDLAFRFQQIRTVWQTQPVSDPVALHIYTDASSGGGPEDGYLADCAWAFTVWVIYPDEELLLGHSAHTSVPPDTRFHCGEQDGTPLTAERLALFWAFCWLIEVGCDLDLPVVMCYDCTTAGDAAFANARTYCSAAGHNRCSLAEALSLVRQCAMTRVAITPRHVRSHVGISRTSCRISFRSRLDVAWSMLSPELFRPGLHD